MELESHEPAKALSREGSPPASDASPSADASAIDQRFAVSFDYPVRFVRGVFDPRNPALRDAIARRGEDRRHRTIVYLDRGLAEARPGLLASVKDYFHAHAGTLELSAPPQVVPGGEAAKRSWETVRDILTTIGNLHLDRQSCVVAAGGGSVLDMVGFAASIVHRGLRLVRLPSTTLAQCDAGIGVKNGMNEHGQKNFIGSFAPPFAVLSDLDFLTSLPFEAWIAGIAEAFKVAIIKDAAFLEVLVRSAPALRAREASALEPALRRAAALHLEHIRTNGDPFEFGSARPLDFGHWAAHKLEVLSGYSLGHGQAVAVGIALDSAYAQRTGLLSASELETILDALDESGLPTYIDLLDRRDRAGTLLILEGLEEFREHLGGRLTVTLPQGLGAKLDVHQMDPGLVSACVEELRIRSPGR